MSPNTWQRLSGTDGLGAVVSGYLSGAYGTQQGARGFFEYATRAIWMPQHGELHFRGSGHQSDGIHVRYKESTGQWEVLNSFSGWEHQYSHTAYDPIGDVLYAKRPAAATIHSWDWSSGGGSWSTARSLPFTPQIATALEWFPEANGGRGGLIHYGQLSRGPLHVSNADVSSWRSVPTSIGTENYHFAAAYLPAQQVVLFGGGNGGSSQIGILYPDDRVERRNGLPQHWGPQDNGGMGTVLADTVTGRIFFISGYSDTIYEHDFEGDRWYKLASTPAIDGRSFAAMISSYGCIMLVEGGSTDASPDIWLYKL